MRIVIKVGTHVLIDQENKIDPLRIEAISRQILALQKLGHQVILVSSGAIAAGRTAALALPADTPKPLLASIGQPYLANWYNNYTEKEGIFFGQFLLARTDFSNRDRYDQLSKALEAALTRGIVPLLNENDGLATSTTTLGDNDILAAMAAIAAKAEKLIILTNLEGLYDGDPKKASSKLIPEVKNVDLQLERLCAPGTSELGRGGMLSKVRAAKHAISGGIETYIADGRKNNILEKILSGKPVGTKFTAKNLTPVHSYDRWLLAAKGFGQIVVDGGAAGALAQKKSLLLPGIIQLKGVFGKDEVVEIISKTGLTLAYGKTNFSNQEIQKALDARKKDPVYTMKKEVIHRDYMVNA